MGQEVWHPNQWRAQFGILWNEVLVRHDRVRRVTTLDTRPSSVREILLEADYSGCVLFDFLVI